METLSTSNVGRGIIAGFAGTVVLSVFMVMKQMMGLMPELDIISMLSKMMGNSGPVIAWLVHFIIGSVVWGVIYAWLQPMLPGPNWFLGALLATVAWLLTMIIIMPMAGAGVFGLSLGMMVPIATLMLHWIYGAVMGAVYATLIDRTGNAVGVHS